MTLKPCGPWRNTRDQASRDIPRHEYWSKGWSAVSHLFVCEIARFGQDPPVYRYSKKVDNGE